MEKMSLEKELTDVDDAIKELLQQKDGEFYLQIIQLISVNLIQNIIIFGEYLSLYLFHLENL